MKTNFLPRQIGKVRVPPIKCQGIKTKLVPFIAENVKWTGKGRWIEPFLGSGVVAFNIAPKHAILSDSNKHVINFYSEIQNGGITPESAKEFLNENGALLSERGAEHYYEVRKRFNKNGDPLDLLFLNRACFNGVMRFNSKGEFNVPFCRKSDRFRTSYITKIVNQIKWVSEVISEKDWIFSSGDWRDVLNRAEPDDFVYLDPPYIGRHTDYFNSWTEEDAIELANCSQNLNCGFALSMWYENKYRKNDHISQCWSGNIIRTSSHFYHVGSKESLRNAMVEALVIKRGYEAEPQSAESPTLDDFERPKDGDYLCSAEF